MSLFGTVVGGLLGSAQNKQNHANNLELMQLARTYEDIDYSRARRDYLGDIQQARDDLKFASDLSFKDKLRYDKQDYYNFLKTSSHLQQLTHQTDKARYGLERSAKAEDFQMLRDQGLTPQEIIGSPIGGMNSGSASGQVLGNGPQHRLDTQSAAAARSQAQNAAADRAAMLQIEQMRQDTQLGSARINAAATLAASGVSSATNIRGQDIQAKTAKRGQELDFAGRKIVADASKAVASINAAASRDVARVYSDLGLKELAEKTRVNNYTISKIAADTSLALQDKRIKDIVHDERWSKLFAGMGPDNMIAAMVSALHGVPTQDILTGLELDPVSRDTIDAALREMQSFKSHVGRETGAATDIIVKGLNSLLGVSPGDR
jgi:hypothetical protein